MFLITAVFGSASAHLMFKTPDTFAAAAALAKNPAAQTFNPEMVSITDDFGQTLEIKRSSVHGFLFEDTDQSMMIQVERGLQQLRSQIIADKTAGADPAIRQHMQQKMQGPPVLTPGFNGVFRQ